MQLNSFAECMNENEWKKMKNLEKDGESSFELFSYRQFHSVFYAKNLLTD